MAKHFSDKIQVHEPRRNPSVTLKRINHTIEQFIIDKNMEFNLPKKYDSKKAVGPDHISMHILKRCADQLALPFSKLFQESGQHWKKNTGCTYT